jgi:hypothetical protein
VIVLDPGRCRWSWAASDLVVHAHAHQGAPTGTAGNVQVLDVSAQVIAGRWR